MDFLCFLHLADCAASTAADTARAAPEIATGVLAQAVALVVGGLLIHHNRARPRR